MKDIVVADFYELSRRKGGYSNDLSGLKPEMKNVKVPRDYVEQINKNYQDNGRWYVIHEELSKEYKIKREQQREKREEKKNLEKLGNSAELINALSNIGKVTNQKPKGRPKKEESNLNTD